MKLSDFHPQGVLLSRTGCFKTKVDVKTVLEKIGYKEEEIPNLSLDSYKNEINSSCSEKKPDIKK
jgi:hypothetical protein